MNFKNAIVATSVLLFAKVAIAQISFSVTAAPTLPSDNQSNTKFRHYIYPYRLQAIMRNTGPTIGRPTGIAGFAYLVSAYNSDWPIAGQGWPYGAEFQLINSSTGTKDLRLIADATTSSEPILAGADSVWNLDFKADGRYYLPGADDPGVASYTLWFRVYNMPCELARANSGNNQTQWTYLPTISDPCLVFETPVTTTTINWTGAGASAENGARYPMINNRPYNSDPPASLPASTFLACDSTGRCF